MVRALPISCLLLAGLCAACADRDPPAADPVRVELLLASLDAEQQAAPHGAGKIEEKIEKADRIAGSLMKVQADRIDPNMVVALVSR
jgi:hypothetical protein